MCVSVVCIFLSLSRFLSFSRSLAFSFSLTIFLVCARSVSLHL